MRKIMLGIAMAVSFSLGGCAFLQNVENYFNNTTISANDVYIAANAFDAVEQTATNYLTLPACTGSNGPVCRNASVVAALTSSIRAGRVARNSLEAAIKAGGNQPISQSLYSQLTSATSTIKSMLADFNL